MANYPVGFRPSHSARFSLGPVTRCSGPASLNWSAEQRNTEREGEIEWAGSWGGGGLKERARGNEKDDTGNDRETSIYEEKKKKSRVYT